MALAINTALNQRLPSSSEPCVGIARPNEGIGDADQHPVGTVLRITGTGDVYTGLFSATYPGDTRVWHSVVLVELRDGKVLKETTIFGAPFDPPAWRAKWVERM